MRPIQPCRRMAPQSHPIALPHITWSRDTLYFCGRAARSASREDWMRLVQCDGSKTLLELASSRDEARTIAAAAPWLLWWENRLGAVTAGDSGRITRLVLSPGVETAWLGMGGRLLMDAATCPTKVITCFGLTARTVESLAFLTPGDLAAITRDESSLAARLAGVTQERWEFPARELRPPGDRQSRSNVDWLKNMLREVIQQLLTGVAPKEIFVPMAVEPGSDAGVLLDVILSMYVDGLLEASQVHIFESSPLARGHRPVDEFLSRFEKSYLHLQEYFVPLAARGLQKGSHLEVFRSCIDNPLREAWLASAARNATLSHGWLLRDDESGFAERFWRASLTESD
jgi:hypothetical protein